MVDASAAHTCAVCAGEWCDACGPEREPELDTDAELAWRLGDGAILLVGARHAVHVTTAGDRRTLVPDEQVQDPSHVRRRAVAAALGLTPSAGLVLTAAVPGVAALTGDALWADVEQSAWWSTRPATDGTVDPAAAALLPGLAGEPVDGEESLAELIAELRHRETAPIPPAVAAVPFAVVRRVDVESGRFHYRELWHEGDDDPMLADESTGALVPSRHTPVPGGRAIAVAQAGPVAVEVDGLHRSFVCRLTAHSRTETVFVPGLPGATLRAEDQLAHLVRDNGLVVVRNPWHASDNGLDFSTPAPGTEVTRRSTARPPALLADASGEPMVSLLSDEPLPERLADVSVVLDDEPLRSALTALDRKLEPFVIGESLEVEEVWTSPHATASRTYLVFPGAPLGDPGGPLPVLLADGSQAHRDVSVDSLGHLFDVRRATGCPGCGNIYGPCCGDVAKLFRCTACRRPACGTCLEGAEVAETRCARCGDTSCRACSRELAVETCRMCERDMCRSCRDDSICRTCQALAPATADGLPPELAANGLTVVAAEDKGGRIVRLTGTHRRELVVLNGPEIVRWKTATEDDLLPLRIAAARAAGTGDVDVHALPEQHCPPAPRDWLALDRESGTELHWAVMAGDTRRAGTFDPPPVTDGASPDPSLRDELTALVGAPTRVPSRAVLDAVEVTPSPSTARVVACRMRTDDLLAVDGRGLVRRKATGPAVSETVAEWQPSGEPVAWAEAGWSPQPSVVAHAQLEDWEAALVRVGGHALLGVLAPGQHQPVWHTITDDPAELDRGLVGATVVGPHTTVRVTALTRADQLTGLTLAGATLLGRSLWYRGVVVPPQPDEVAPDLARSTVAPTGVPAAPTSQADLPAALIDHLSRRLPPITPSCLAIGLDVEEVWSLPDGSQMQVAYEVPAGQTQGRVPDAVTGIPLAEPQACRSHHLVAAVRPCATCLTSTCGACTDGVTPCRLCAGLVCRRCVATEDGRCPACAALTKVGALSRSRYGAARGDAVWHGTAPNTEVTVRRLHNEWTLERTDHQGTVTLPLTEPFLTHIQTLLP
ncbi:hypothetical protein JIG36_36765 [Actinoplanes sp. LDG1-06]|uniref:Uncharacterized protein n=1 Tax=Paractinoplanes ovalisporus TaxID=2810368 RepID=A0ABS2ANV0_9ACTN|nr:hypothetical protein [Actinoplanes ovalisporus]MBM2621068.1 hypothetical protein [Actinoplanes ovalisporus]